MNRIYVILFISLALSLLSLEVVSQENYLKKRLSFSVNEVPVKAVFKKMETQGGFQFSYNSEIIDSDSLISYECKNVTVLDVLDQLFNKQFSYKSVGSHIIILKKNYNRKTIKENKDIQYKITGYIVDNETGEDIISATVYDVQGSFTAMTNPEGQFSMYIPADNKYRSLTFSKSGYLDTIIIISPVENAKIEIPLRPIETSIQPMEIKEADIQTSREINELGVVNFMVANEVQTHAYNLSNIPQYRTFQASVVPYAGTHLKSSGAFINTFSLNLLVGYSGGVEGVEIGGLLNMNRLGVKGFQLGGIGNITGDNIWGVQVGGIFNNVGSSVKGLQVAGIYNHSRDSLVGMQIAGITNYHEGSLRGMQLAGIFNYAEDSVNGGQVSGIYNHCNSNLSGAQISSIANTTAGNVTNLQLSAITNYCNSLRGVQLSCINNIVNQDMEGSQISAISNIVRGTNMGSQLSVIYNYTKNQNGFQLGLVNVCDSIKGVSLGLFTFARHGYLGLELSYNEVFYANTLIKTGSRNFYNIFSLSIGSGINNQFIWAPGYGFGTKIRLGKRFDISLELTASHVNEQPGWNSSLNLLNKFTTTLDWNITDHIQFFVGPSINLHISSMKDADTDSYSSQIANNPFYTSSNATTQFQSWVGGTIGFRFTK